MSLELTFRPIPEQKIKVGSKDCETLSEAIFNIPSLPSLHTKTTITHNTMEVKEITFIIEGIAVIDKESAHMLSAVVQEQLQKNNLPFFLSNNSWGQRFAHEPVFFHTRFKPNQSRNALLLSTIKGLEVPAHYCCPLSGDIMDDPVFDVRNPTVLYDYDFLIYWLRKSYPKLMPDTRLPYDKAFLKRHFDLKNEITAFVKNSIESYEKEQLDKIFIKYSLSFSKEKENLNKALLQISDSSCPEKELHDDTIIILKEGANINCQYPGLKNNFTALHLALSKKQYIYACHLLHMGAYIDIPNGNKTTAFEMIMLDKQDELIFTCESFGLITVSKEGLISLVKKTNTLPLSMETSTQVDKKNEVNKSSDRDIDKKEEKLTITTNLSELLKAKYKQNVVTMETIGKALRNACANNFYTDLPVLLATGIDVNCIANDSLNKKTPLHWAVERGAVECVRVLLQAGAKTDLPDQKNLTAKQYAAVSNNSEIHTLFGIKKESTSQLKI